MTNKIYILFFSLIILSSVASAQLESLGTFKQSEEILLKQLCANCTYVNITSINYPNGSTAIGQQQMQVSNNEYYYLLDSEYTNDLGRYNVNGFGNPDGSVDVWAYYFDVTTTGKTFSDAQGLSGLGIFGGSIALMFFFMILGFKFTETSKPLALFFVVISVFMAIYSLQLGITYATGILEWEGLTNTQTTVYTLILYLVSGIALISFILMSIAFLREFGKGNMMKNYGAGFDPISQTYQ
jgi:amino acid transporter